MQLISEFKTVLENIIQKVQKITILIFLSSQELKTFICQI